MAHKSTINPNRQTRTPHHLLACALLFAMGAATPASADIWSWNAGSGNWSTAGHWLPSSVPGISPLQDYDIRIGNVPGVQNSTVFLNSTPQFTPFYYDQLRLYNGMTLDMNGLQLGGLNGSVTLTGANSRLIVRSGAGLNFHDFTAADMTLDPGTHLQMADDGRLRTFTLNSRGLISGAGTIHAQGAGPSRSFTNSGTISGSNNGGLTIIQDSTGRLDLDGITAESSEFGQLSLASPFSVLTFEGDQLSDYFSGTVTMGSGSLLNMNMSNGWIADAQSTFNVASSIFGAAAQIDGGHFSFAGNLNLGGTHGHLRVLADATLQSYADVFVGNGDWLEFDGSTTVLGGTYTISEGARMDFNGPTQVSGGTFNMVNEQGLGFFAFNGPTTWSGPVTINGTGRQVGNATVSIPIIINATILEMDGDGTTTWTINNSLTVNTQAVEILSQAFDGAINMNVGALGRLTINLEDPTDSWTMNGTMNLAGLGILTTMRVAGSPMVVTGDLNMSSGIAQIASNTTFQNANLSIANGGTLRMRATTTVDAATIFSGTGILQNWFDGSMLLHSGVSFNQVGLLNNGPLHIGEDGPGIASVDRFTSSATATLNVDVAGYIAGSEHDLLLVTSGTATLAGELSVNLLAFGVSETFAPTIGDEFTIISALGGISGTFVNNPTTQVDNLRYEWTVIYNPNTVVLSLEHIERIPECGCAADYNQDGGINGEDVEAFFIDFENSTGCADINQDGGINGEDVEAFFIHFENGGC